MHLDRKSQTNNQIAALQSRVLPHVGAEETDFLGCAVQRGRIGCLNPAQSCYYHRWSKCRSVQSGRGIGDFQ